MSLNEFSKLLESNDIVILGTCGTSKTHTANTGCC